MSRKGLPVDHLSDELLLAGLAANDRDAALAFVRRFQRKVFGIAYAVVGDTGLAEDVAQAAFERAFRHAQVYDPRRGSVTSWLGTITHRLALDSVRTRRAAPFDPQDLAAMITTVTSDVEAHVVAAERGAALRSALRGLPGEQARAVVMAGMFGLTAQEVAEADQIPLGTAKTRIRTAMAKLRDALSDEGAIHD